MSIPASEHPQGVLLPLPPLGDVSDAQFRGAACAWCAVILAPATAVDLGPRPIRLLDGHITVRPRGCRVCVAEQLPATRQAHVAGCEQCVDNPAGCDTARALRHLELTVSPQQKLPAQPGHDRGFSEARALMDHTDVCAECITDTTRVCPEAKRLVRAWSLASRGVTA